MTNIDISDEDFHALIREECSNLANLLVEKNVHYGNSLIKAPGAFSNASPLSRVQARADDKLSRIISGQEEDPEDGKLDLIGYLVLERAIVRAMEGVAPKTPGVTEPTKAPKARKPRKAKITAPTVQASTAETTPTEDPDSNSDLPNEQADVSILAGLTSEEPREVLESNQDFLTKVSNDNTLELL